jgi:alkylation response protein AidB-like acyl-CoA dehydrogenase
MASRYLLAESLERALGDPLDPRAPLAFARVVQFDEVEAFPGDFVQTLRDAGAFAQLVPAELGGALRSFDESLLLLRLIARRDLTTAIAFGQTFLGAIPVWMAGSEAQQQALAHAIRDGLLGCLALTEEAHGGDLLACEFAAARTGDGYTLSGRKWLINNATGGGTVVVYARTGAPTFSGFSLFLIEKRRLADASRYRPLPKVRTLGIRGADISGFECCDLPVPAAAVIGAPGRGYELTLKTLQVSRTMCAALSLGAADTALRAALGFALERRVFNTTVAEIPAAREQLIGAYADLLVGECAGIAAARALQCCPDRAAVWSSIVKFLVPTVVEELIQEAARVLGARYYLRQGHYGGVFQKAQRDNAVVSLFDGSTAVNLHIISGQLAALATRRASGERTPDLEARLQALFDRRVELRWAQFPRDAQMKFTNSGADEIVDGLIATARESLPDGIAAPVQALVDALRSLDARVMALQAAGAAPNVPERFELARRYCLIHAAACCLLTWRYNHGAIDRFFDDGQWLVACLRRVVRRLTGDPSPLPVDTVEAVGGRMRQQFDECQLFSTVGVQLAGAPVASA